jgi:hypothetical protein
LGDGEAEVDGEVAAKAISEDSCRVRAFPVVSSKGPSEVASECDLLIAEDDSTAEPPSFSKDNSGSDLRMVDEEAPATPAEQPGCISPCDEIDQTQNTDAPSASNDAQNSKAQVEAQAHDMDEDQEQSKIKATIDKINAELSVRLVTTSKVQGQGTKRPKKMSICQCVCGSASKVLEDSDERTNGKKGLNMGGKVDKEKAKITPDATTQITSAKEAGYAYYAAVKYKITTARNLLSIPSSDGERICRNKFVTDDVVDVKEIFFQDALVWGRVQNPEGWILIKCKQGTYAVKEKPVEEGSKPVDGSAATAEETHR